MEYIEVDKITFQVISAGSPTPMFEGLIVEVPELPQRKDPKINICDYYWDGGSFLHRPLGNWHKRTMKDMEMARPIAKATIRFLLDEVNFLRGLAGRPTLTLEDIEQKIRSHIT